MAIDSTEENKFSRDIIYIALIIVLFGLNIYQYYTKKVQIVAAETQIADNKAELNEMNVKIGVLSQQLDERIIELQKLGGDVDSLIAIKEELEREKKALAKNSNIALGKLKKLEQKLETYSLMLKQKDKQIAKLKEANEYLVEETTSLKEERNDLNDEINSLKDDKDNMSSKIKSAAILNAKNIKTIAINKKGKEDNDGEYRAKYIHQLKISYQLIDNPLVDVGTKTIYFVIKGPRGVVIYNPAARSGTFESRGKDVFYTDSDDIIFDRSGTSRIFTYKKQDAYQKGQHTIELYTQGKKIGSSSFLVK